MDELKCKGEVFSPDCLVFESFMRSAFHPLFLGGQADRDVLPADCFSAAQDVTEFMLTLFFPCQGNKMH